MVPSTLTMLARRVLTDSAVRAAFLANPEDFLTDERITGEERRVLLRLRTRLATATNVGDISIGPLSPWP